MARESGRRRAGLRLAVVCAGLLGAGTAVAAAASDVPPAVRSAVDLYARENRGVITFERAVDVAVKAGPISHTERNEALILTRDGAVESIRFLSFKKSGKPVSAAEIERYERKVNDEIRGGRGYFHRPYDPRYVEAYAFAPLKQCVDCPAGGAGFAFSSVHKDTAHGSGTIVIDGSNHVVRLAYTPYVLPEHANEATVIETSDQVLPGCWNVVRVHGHYAGRVGPIAGAGVFEERTEHFRRYPSLEEALESMKAELTPRTR